MKLQKKNGHNLRGFIDLVGLPPIIYPDNYKNFKEGLFKQPLQRFGINPTHTKPYSPWKNIAKPVIWECTNNI